MPTKMQIYYIYPEVNETRPIIDWQDPLNSNIDWRSYEAFESGDEYFVDSSLEVFSAAKGQEYYDFWACAGTIGIISQRLYEVLSCFSGDCLKYLSMRLDGDRFYIPAHNKCLECLDLDKSKISRFKSHPYNVKNIEKHIFYESLIPQPGCFCIPQSRLRVYVTDQLKKILDEMQFTGIAYVPA